jgi:hypothetical protein
MLGLYKYQGSQSTITISLGILTAVQSRPCTRIAAHVDATLVLLLGLS